MICMYVYERGFVPCRGRTKEEGILARAKIPGRGNCDEEPRDFGQQNREGDRVIG